MHEQMGAIGNMIVDAAGAAADDGHPIADPLEIEIVAQTRRILESRLRGTRSTFVTPESTQDNAAEERRGRSFSGSDMGRGAPLFGVAVDSSSDEEETKEPEDPKDLIEEKDDQAGGKRNRSTRKRMRNKRASKRKSKRMNKKRRGSRSKRHH